MDGNQVNQGRAIVTEQTACIADGLKRRPSGYNSRPIFVDLSDWPDLGTGLQIESQTAQFGQSAAP
jgi:hypothetical protein